jgi:diaminopimelate epimerase
MRLPFTKMQGAGNDFVVLDATREPLALTPAQLRHLGDRRFGVGADQILVVEPSPRRAWTSATASSTTAATRSNTAATARAASCATCTNAA